MVCFKNNWFSFSEWAYMGMPIKILRDNKPRIPVTQTHAVEFMGHKVVICRTWLVSLAYYIISPENRKHHRMNQINKHYQVSNKPGCLGTAPGRGKSTVEPHWSPTWHKEACPLTLRGWSQCWLDPARGEEEGLSHKDSFRWPQIEDRTLNTLRAFSGSKHGHNSEATTMCV